MSPLATPEALEKDEKEHPRHTGKARAANRLPREKSIWSIKEKKIKGKKNENKKKGKKGFYCKIQLFEM